MGAAMVMGLLGESPAPAITIIDPSPAVRMRFADQPGVRVEADPAALAAAEVVILAVKPQVGAEVCRQLAPHLNQRHSLISILAGIPLATLSQWLPQVGRLIRAMPNTPMAIGQGMVGLAGDERCQAADLEQAAALFRPGAEVVIIAEAQMDALTAVSGSGPAYLFRFAEAMYEAALGLGLEATTAQSLVTTTLSGSAAYLQQRCREERSFVAGKLRDQVTSPGGTTAAALAVFDQGQLSELVQSAMVAARDRSLALAKGEP